MTKPTAMLWNGWPPTNKNKWKNKKRMASGETA